MPSIPPNNTSGLYGIDGSNIPVDDNVTANNISASGNVTVGGFIIANGSITTESNFVGNLIGNVTGNVTGNIVLSGGNTEVIYNNNGVTGSSPAFTFDDFSNVMSVTGNIAASGFFLGNGSLLSGITANYGNANVEALLPVYTGDLAGANLALTGSASAVGNITGNFFLGNGSQLTGLPENYSNANVAAYLPTYSGNLNPAFVSASGNVTAVNLKTSGATGNIVGANYVSANFYLGDGGLLSNISSSYGNAQVATFLNAFGSNTISTTGNVTAGYFIGDGSLLTNLPGGSYGNANVADFLANSFGSNSIATTGNITAANFLGNIAAANVVGTVATANTATTAGTVTGNAQANITSVGTLTDLAVTGNITSATVSTTGNITGNYFLGNGSQLTGLPAGYSNADVNSHLAAFGSNSISTTGNVTAGYFLGPNFQATTSAGGALKNSSGTTQASWGAGGGDNFAVSVSTNMNGANAQIDISPTGSGHVHIKPTGTGAVEIAPTNTGSINNMIIGNVTPAAANVTTLNATGNITGNYFLGNGSQLTGITTAAGGSNTQIQFNDGTVFAGNSNMTFDNLSGDITLGNVVYNGLKVLPGNIGNAIDGTGITANITDYQLRIGNSFNGNTNWALGLFGPGSAATSGVGARLLQSDTWNWSNTAVRLSGFVAQNYVKIQGNISSTSARFQGACSFLAIGGGANSNTVTSTNTVNPVQAFASGVLVGNVNANLNLGNTSISYVNGQLFTATVANNSTVNYLTVMGGQILAQGGSAGNIANVIGYHVAWGGNVGTTPTNYSVFYHAGNTSSNTILPPVTTGNVARSATNYYAFRNDDALAKAKLGSLELYHNFTANTATTTGTVNISKNDGQFQQIYPTGNITIGTFTNFVTRTQKPDGTQVNQTDVVTLLIQQGATPYTITMPTGNANIKYANTSATVANTANSTTRITVTGTYNYNVGGDQYLIAIDPEYITV